jgi:hypothetical protein
MYTGSSGNNCVCTRVAVEIVMYVHGLQWEKLCASIQSFLGRCRFVRG